MQKMSCDLPVVPRMARALKVFLLANALAQLVSSDLQVVHFGGESAAGQRQKVSARGFDEKLSKNRIFPTAKSPGVLSAPLSVSSSFRGSRLARALSLRPVGWEEAPGKKSAADVAVPTTYSGDDHDDEYKSLGRGVCACRNPNPTARKNGFELDLCNSDVFLQAPAAPAHPALKKDSCRSLCSDAADCMAYQATRHCVLFLWNRVPIGVFDEADIRRSDFVEGVKKDLRNWAQVPCMRKRFHVMQLTDPRSRFQPGSVEKFAIMPRARELHRVPFGVQYDERPDGKERFCTCRATTPSTGGDDTTEEKETVCRVADEKENMSQEAAESLCLERNRREALLRGSTNEKDRESADPRGCAGFMSFTPVFSAHPKAKHVLFFSGYQNVTGIATDKEQYEQKGGSKTGLASLYLNRTPDGRQPIVREDEVESIGGFEVARVRAHLPRCVYYVADNHGRPAGSPDPPRPGSLGAGPTERMEVSGNLGQAERMEVLFNVAVGGVAVFSIALLVVAVFLVVACRKYQKSRRALGGRDVGKDRKPKHQESLPREQTCREGSIAARVDDEKGPQPATSPLTSVATDKLASPTREKENTKKRDHAWAPPWQGRAGAPFARQVRDVAEDVDRGRGFPTRYAEYRLDVRDQQPQALQGHRLRAVRAIGIGQGVEDGRGARGEADHDCRDAPLALGNNDPVAFPEPLTQTRQAIMGLQMESQEGLGEVPLPVNPHAHSTGEVGREGSATSGTRQVLERATRAAVSSASLSLSLLGQYGAEPEEFLLARGDGEGEIDGDGMLALAPTGDGASTDTVLLAPLNSSVTGAHSGPTSETPEGTSYRGGASTSGGGRTWTGAAGVPGEMVKEALV